jgi:hypothetical protein
MSEKVIEHKNTVGVVAFAAAVIVLYSLWGATLLSAQRDAAYASNNPQTQLARN